MCKKNESFDGLNSENSFAILTWRNKITPRNKQKRGWSHFEANFDHFISMLSEHLKLFIRRCSRGSTPRTSFQSACCPHGREPARSS